MTLSAYIRRGHRIIAMLWLLSLILTLAIPAAGEKIPGPSLPALFFIATIVTGIYLLARPWVRGTMTTTERLKRLKQWNLAVPTIIRRIHRIVATLVVLLLVLALSLAAAGGAASELVIIPIVVLLIFLVLTGSYMFVRPWVTRVRAR
jgi:hypothetical protein